MGLEVSGPGEETRTYSRSCGGDGGGVPSKDGGPVSDLRGKAEKKTVTSGRKHGLCPWDESIDLNRVSRRREKTRKSLAGTIFGPSAARLYMPMGREYQGDSNAWGMK